DLFKNSQLVLVGRYKNSVNVATIRLSGKVAGREATFSFTNQAFPGERSENQFLPRLWATRRVGYLLEQIRLNGENKELKDEVIALGTRYGIVTPYTSFLVTEDGSRISLRDMPADQRRAMEAMRKMEIVRASGGIGRGNAPASAPAKSGEDAVVYS